MDFSLGIPTGNFSYQEKPSRANLQVFSNSVYFARMKNTLKVIKFYKDNKILLSTGFLGIKPNLQTTNLDYLYYIIRSNNFQNLKNKHCKGATQETLSDSSAKNIELIYPELIEQNSISFILNKFFNEKENYEKILQEEEKKFTFLLEELMSGRLRIKN